MFFILNLSHILVVQAVLYEKEGIKLVKHIKTKFKKIIEENLKACILICVIFIAGATLASLQNFRTTEEEIRLYLKDFMQNILSSGTDLTATFNISIIGYIKFFLVMLLSSLTIVGAPIVLVYTLIEGFSFGTVLVCVMRTYGAKGILIVLSTMIPHLLFAVPICVGMCVFSMKHSLKLGTLKNDLKYNLIKPLFAGVLFLCGASIASLVQGYIEPLLIKLIASQFV